jgi:hypothetical protein
MTPMPPAFETAAASSGPAATFIPEYTVDGHQHELRSDERNEGVGDCGLTGERDGMVDPKQLGEGRGEDLGRGIGSGRHDERTGDLVREGG